MQLFFVTEASHAVGMGHFMRCFALAEEASARGHATHFIMQEAPPAARTRLAQIGAHWIPAGPDMRETCVKQQLENEDWWVIDGYLFHLGWINCLHRIGRVLLFDDLCALSAYPFEIILNASPTARQLAYPNKGKQTRLLAGPQWSTIRREFQDARPLSAPRQGSIAITMGGSDPYGLTRPVAEMVLHHCPDLQLKVIMGPASRDDSALTELVSQSGRGQILKDPPNLARILGSTDLVITAAGGSIGELCALRQMAVCLVVSDNQASALLECPYPVVDVRAGLEPGKLIPAVTHAFNDTPFQEKVRTRAHQLVDGLGCRRILNELAKYPCTTS